MAIHPAGTVTLLFTDIEGSTRLLQQLGSRYAELLAQHRRLLRSAVETRGGTEIGAQGDACFAAFPRAQDAVAAAVAAQHAIGASTWPGGAAVRVRMGIHTGEPLIAEAGYVGMDVHRTARICAAAHGGQVLLSQATRELVADDPPLGVLLRDLGEHHLKDLPRPMRLWQVVAPDLRADFPPLRSVHAPPHNLPAQLTSFIGRERESIEVKRLIATARLVTLTGPGGCGKTRLALQVARDLVAEFADGARLVELAALSTPAAVPQALATALGLHEEPSRELLAVVCDYLRPRLALLVLDNCEHLIAACAHVAEALLRGCPDLRILATSREPLRVSGESIYVVPPLPTPDPTRLPPLERLTEYEAVRLFLERAGHAAGVMRNGTGLAVAQICRRLDGLPLAIELAAARARTLSVEQIAKRLDDRFRLLGAGSRTALPHHQTLRSALDWSHDLLSEPERILFRRLSVFAGGFTLDAAEAIGSGDGGPGTEVLDLLARLVDKSLVMVQHAPAEVRYWLLETVRQYGQERLAASGEAVEVRTRHRDWFTGLAERGERGLRSPEQGAWLARLETEHDNLRTALEWCRQRGEADAGLRLAGALWEFWYVRGHWAEGRRWIEHLAASPGAASAAGLAKALIGAAALAYRQGDYERAAALGDESLRLSRARGDTQGIALALSHLGYVAHGRGDRARAAALCEESLRLCRRLGDAWSSAFPLNMLGEIALDAGDCGRAAGYFTEALAVRRARGGPWGIASSLRLLGRVAHRAGALPQAAALYKESLASSRDLADKRGTVLCLESLAGLAIVRQDLERAARLLGAAEALRGAIGYPLSPSDRAEHDRRVATIRLGLREPAFTAVWSEGRALPVDRAIDEAMRLPG